MRLSQRLIAATVFIALSAVLGGCSGNLGGNFDPSDLLDFLDTKKKLAGERKPVFPEGVPGLEQGVPKELYKGSVEEQQQQNAQTATAAPPPAAEEPKAKKSKGKKTKKQAPATGTALDAAQEPAAAADPNAAPDPNAASPRLRRLRSPRKSSASVRPRRRRISRPHNRRSSPQRRRNSNRRRHSRRRCRAPAFSVDLVRSR
jgi:hypothetical protein